MQSHEAQGDGRSTHLHGVALYTMVGLLLLVQVLDGVDMHSLAFVGADVRGELQLTRSTLGACIGVAFLGMAVGAVAFGWVADRSGRRKTLIGIVGLFGIGSLATSQVHDMETLLALRFLTGLALGGVYPVAAALLIEAAPPTARTTAVSIMSVGSAAGAAVCGALAALLVPTFGWRAVFLAGGLLPLAIIPLLFLGIPRDRIAAGSFRSMRRTDDSARSLWHGKLANTTLLLWGALLFCAVPVFFVIGWLPTLARDAGSSVAHASLGATLFNVVGALGGVVGARFVDRLGLRCAAFMAAGGAVAMLALSHTIGEPLFLTGCAVAGLLTVGLLTLTGAAAGRFYPMAVRGLGVGCCLGIMRLGAAGAPWASGLLMDGGLSPQLLFIAASACMLIVAAMIWLLDRQPALDQT